MKGAWLLRLIGICLHEHHRQEREGDERQLVCEDCGRRVPVVRRSDEERAEMRRRFPDGPTRTAQVARPASPAKIVGIGKRGRHGGQ